MPKANRDMASSSQVPLLDLKQQVPYSSQKLHQLYSYHFDRPIAHCTQMIILLMTTAQDVSMHTVHDSSHYYYYYYYYHHHHQISHFSALAGKYSPILACGNEQD